MNKWPKILVIPTFPQTHINLDTGNKVRLVTLVLLHESTEEHIEGGRGQDKDSEIRKIGLSDNMREPRENDR